MKKRMIRNVILCALGLCIVRGADAGERSNIRGMGMARTYVVSSEGLDAIGLNPANIATTSGAPLSISIMSVGGHIGSDFLNYDLYTRYFTGVETDSGRVARELTENDKQVILNNFTDPLARTSAELEARLFGVSYVAEGIGAVAFTVTDNVGAFAVIPRDYVEFALKGNPVGSSYHFNDTRAQSSWTREYALTLGRSFDIAFLRSFSAGVAVKLVHGYGYYGAERFNTSLVTDEHATLTGSVDFLARRAGGDPLAARYLSAYRLFPEVAGKGMAFDAGVRGAFTRYLSAAVSVTDIGTIRWRKNTRVQQADTSVTVDDPLDETQRNAIESLVRGRTYTTGAFATRLPTTIRAGVALAVDKLPEMGGMPGGLLLELNYNQPLFETSLTNTIPRVSLGAEYTLLEWLPIRTGVSFGGTDYMNLALGFGIHLPVFEFEVASENVTWLMSPHSFSRGSVSIGTRFRL
jgi:hypothetical protein